MQIYMTRKLHTHIYILKIFQKHMQIHEMKHSFKEKYYA